MPEPVNPSNEHENLVPHLQALPKVIEEPEKPSNALLGQIISQIILEALEKDPQMLLSVDALRGNPESREKYQELAILDLNKELVFLLVKEAKSFIAELVKNHKKYLKFNKTDELETSLPQSVPRRVIEEYQRTMSQPIVGEIISYLKKAETYNQYQAILVDATNRTEEYGLFKIEYKSLAEVFDIEFDLYEKSAVAELVQDTFQKIYLRNFYFTVIKDSLTAIDVLLPDSAIAKMLPITIRTNEDPWDVLERSFLPKFEAINQVMQIVANHKSEDAWGWQETEEMLIDLISKGCRANRAFLKKHHLYQEEAIETAPTQQELSKPRPVEVKVPSSEILKERLSQYESYNNLQAETQKKIVKLLSRFSSKTLTEEFLNQLFSNGFKMEELSKFIKKESAHNQFTPKSSSNEETKLAPSQQPTKEQAKQKVLSFNTSVIDDYLADLSPKLRGQFDKFLSRIESLNPHQAVTSSSQIKFIKGSNQVYEYPIDKHRFYFCFDGNQVHFLYAGDKDNQDNIVNDIYRRNH